MNFFQIIVLWLVNQLRGRYPEGLIISNANEHLFKSRSRSQTTQLTKEPTMISETGLANMANANDDKVFFYSRFSERPWALRKKRLLTLSTTSFALKNKKGLSSVRRMTILQPYKQNARKELAKTLDLTRFGPHNFPSLFGLPWF